MMQYTFLSATILLVLITDPIGNIPIFANALKHVSPERRARRKHDEKRCNQRENRATSPSHGLPTPHYCRSFTDHRCFIAS